MKILIWQTAYLGDVILATPLIRSLKESFPKAHIAFLGRSFIRELLKGFDIELITFDKGIRESFEIIKKIKGFDIAISPHISLRTALILFASGIPIRVGFDRSEIPWLYTHVVKHRWHMHEVDRNLELLKPIGAQKLERMPLLFVEEEEKEKVIKRFSLPKEFVLISPFSNFRLKEWHLKGWNNLVNLIPLPVVMVGTERDIERSKEIQAKNIINLVGKTSIRDLMAIISLSRAVISCDSSAVHIANALKVPAISIYTSTSPDYGFYPLIGSYLKPNLECSPCSPNPKRCKTSTQACLRGVKEEDVWDKLRLLL